MPPPPPRRAKAQSKANPKAQGLGHALGLVGGVNPIGICPICSVSERRAARRITVVPAPRFIGTADTDEPVFRTRNGKFSRKYSWAWRPERGFRVLPWKVSDFEQYMTNELLIKLLNLEV